MDESLLRASTAERDACADRLHAHATAGRITPDQLSARLSLAHHAVTRGDLARLLSDLPEFRPMHVPADLTRCSDADREGILARMEDVYLEGRISKAEFEERMEIALIARTYEDLRGVLYDLPAARQEVIAWGAEAAGQSLDGYPEKWQKQVARARSHAAAVQDQRRKKSQMSGKLRFFAFVLGPVGCLVLVHAWSHAASSVWTPGTGSPYVIAGIWSFFLALPVLMMLAVPFALASDRKKDS